METAALLRFLALLVASVAGLVVAFVRMSRRHGGRPPPPPSSLS